MSFAIKALSDVLQKERVIYGVVVSVEGDMVRVATPKGGCVARTMEPIHVGDRIKIDGGLATRSPIARRVYSV